LVYAHKLYHCQNFAVKIGAPLRTFLPMIISKEFGKVDIGLTKVGRLPYRKSYRPKKEGKYNNEELIYFMETENYPMSHKYERNQSDIDTSYKQIKSYAPRRYEFDWGTLRQAFGWLVAKYRSYLKGSSVASREWAEAKIKKKKSPGLPFTKFCATKEDLFAHDDWPYLFNMYFKSLFHEEIWPVLLEVNAKKELREIGKPQRLFECASADHAVAGKMFFGEQNDMLSKNQYEIAVGFNPWGTNWNTFVRSFQDTKKVTSDFSQYDSSICPTLLWLVCRMRIMCLMPEDRDVYGFAIESWYYQLIFGFFVMEDGFVYQKEGGMPSGVMTTIQDNSIINHLLWMYAFIYFDTEATYVRYLLEFRHKFMGDDNYTGTDWPMVEALPDLWLTHFGIITKEITISDRPEDHQWLSCSTELIGDTYYPVVNYGKTIDQVLYGENKHDNPSATFVKLCSLRANAYNHKTLYRFLTQMASWWLIQHNREIVNCCNADFLWVVVKELFFEDERIAEMWGILEHIGHFDKIATPISN